MKVALAALALGFACAPLHAQHGLEGKASGKSDGKAEQRRPTPVQRATEPKRVEQRTQPDRVRPATPQSVNRPQDQRAREPERKAPPSMKQDRTRYSDIYPQQKSAPSPAQQLQQQQFERQQLQRQHAAPQQQAAPRAQGSARCSAYPVCTREPGRYGSCQGVEQVYANAQAGRRGIVAQCIQANNPDTCHCAAQCSRVAQCSIF